MVYSISRSFVKSITSLDRSESDPSLSSDRIQWQCSQDDVFTHLYTLVVKPDNTYEVKIDNEKVESGKLEDDWDFLPPKKIKVCFLFV